MNVITAMMPKLSQKNIASGVESIREQVVVLETFLNIAETIFAKISSMNFKQYSESDIGKVQLTPADRLHMLKKVKTATYTFAEERNKLKGLLVTVSNNSAKQAEYLNGINRKYAVKALARSETCNTSLEKVFAELVTAAEQVESVLNVEKQHLENKAEIWEASMLSLNTPIEQYAEWSVVKNQVCSNFESIYTLLVLCGYTGYPIKFQQNNAVQMDPFQTSCLDIESYLVDTPSVMLANQNKYQGLKSPYGDKPITDVLVLVSPSCPETCITSIQKCVLYKYLCSITLCRNLDMYHPQMPFSLHAHSLLKAVNLYYVTQSEAYLKVAVEIVYSAFKLGLNHRPLFIHWFENFETVTQKQDDGCNHPVQLLLLLALNRTNNVHFIVPLVNLLNEVLARTMRLRLASGDCHIEATAFAQQLLHINQYNSPQANMENIMQPEPCCEIVRASCPFVDHHNYNKETLKLLHIREETVTQFIVNTLTPYLRTFHFGLSLQKYLQQSKKSWKNLSKDMESGEFNEVMSHLKQEKVNQSLFSYLGCAEKDIALVSMNMFLQATLHVDSASRGNILDFSVFEQTTFREMTCNLMMNFYIASCQEKNEEYMKKIAHVSYEEAKVATVEEFAALLAVKKHTHGLNRRRFWSILRASKENQAKRDIFLAKSNKFTSKCYEKPDKCWDSD